MKKGLIQKVFSLFMAASLLMALWTPAVAQVAGGAAALSALVPAAGPVGTEAAPDVDAGVDQTVDEGAEISFTGVYSDVDGVYTETVALWDFGDGDLVTSTVNVSDVNATHIYVDDGLYTVTLTITDDLGEVGADSLLVTVTNVAPIIAPLADQAITPTGVLTLTVTFTDPGLLDTHSAEILWGDGLSATLVLSDSTYTFELTHTYDLSGTYPVTATVTVTDDDGGAGVENFNVYIDIPTYDYTVWLPLINKPAAAP